MDNQDLEFIKQIIAKHIDPSSHKVFVFGSRATGENRRFSDYDIGFEGDPLDATTYFAIESDFEESDFPFTVDIVEMRDVSEGFKNIALQKIIPINY